MESVWSQCLVLRKLTMDTQSCVKHRQFSIGRAQNFQTHHSPPEIVHFELHPTLAIAWKATQWSVDRFYFQLEKVAS